MAACVAWYTNCLVQQLSHPGIVPPTFNGVLHGHSLGSAGPLEVLSDRGSNRPTDTWAHASSGTGRLIDRGSHLLSPIL